MAVAEVADALEQVAVGDAGGGEEDVAAADQVVDVEDPVEVVAGVLRRLALLLVARPEPAEDLAAEDLIAAAESTPSGRAADPPEQVDAGAG